MKNLLDLNKFDYVDELEAMIERIEHSNLHEEIKQENFALGLPISYMIGDDNVREYSDGTLEYFTYVDGKYTVLRSTKI
ncbi:MAG: hypothetical protein LBV09_05550 [Deferribacteraceae bacterium]|jgi:Flp pilus assembly CpaF family ATPase|nr:hypothetical protein [Deferribacteraceae bacterium]